MKLTYNVIGVFNMIKFERINRTVDGNPRVVCHFLTFIKESDGYDIDATYNIALSRAKKIGGKKHSNKSYGGGIAFICFNEAELESKINELMSNI
jgi:hypothetical protein